MIRKGRGGGGSSGGGGGGGGMRLGRCEADGGEEEEGC